MSQAKRYREDYSKKQQAREADELEWFEKNLEKVEQNRKGRVERFMFIGGGLFTVVLVLIWTVIRSRWLTVEIHPLGLVAIGAAISYVGVRFGLIVEVITRK